MKILFVENKYQTEFWEIIAKELIKKGHEIFWLVQNHNFSPKVGYSYVIPYPSKKSLNNNIDENIKYIIDSDRNLNYFRKIEKGHYSYYSCEIIKILKKLNPNIIFGESTLFHELLTIHNARKLGILYLFPTSCRYPKNRFSFYKYNSLEPFEGDQIPYNIQEALYIIKSIADREVKPDYMVSINESLCVKFIKKWHNALLMTKSYYQGERYNLPSPITKYIIEIENKKLKQQWHKISSMKSFKRVDYRFYLMYPMHQQPESTIDVWGYPFNNQLEIIKELLQNTNEDVLIVIKPNPKPYYELTKELIDFITANNRIIIVPLNVSMDAILNSIDLVVTVTGTIAIECIFSNKPVLTLIKTLNNENPNCIYLNDLSQLSLYVEMVKSNKFPKNTDENQVTFLNRLKTSSYEGVLAPPRCSKKSQKVYKLSPVTEPF